MRTISCNDDLTYAQRKLADAIRDFLCQEAGGYSTNEQGSAFYSPEEWKERGESYGTDSALVLVHDGGALAPCCNWDYESPLREKFDEFLAGLGYYCEQCTCWYSAIYRVKS